MKILFVSLFLPQEKAYHAGGRYVFELIRQLSKRYDMYLATRLEEREAPLLESLKPFCKEVYPYTYRTGAKRGPFGIVRLIFNYMGFSRYANRIAHQGNFDMVQVEWVESALFMKKGACPMVLDAHDVITKPAERLMTKGRGVGRLLLTLRYWCIQSLELRIARRFDMVFTLSEYDRSYLLQREPRLEVETVPIPAGLDITGKIFDRAKNTILFLASYKYRRVNVDAALFFYREVFPFIRKQIPDARFIIAGYGPPEDLISLQEKDASVSVTGFVEDIDEWYKKASVFVAPVLVGGGIIVKILDAMAAGTPVITTSFGNEGIGAKPERDLLVADDPKDFGASVVRLLNEPARAEEIGKNGQEFVKTHFSLLTIMSKIEAAYGKLGRREVPGIK